MSSFQQYDPSPSVLDGSKINRVVAEAIRRREHVWTMAATWRVNPDDGDESPAILDQENILLVASMGCWICEKPETPERANQPCPGRPARR